MQHLPIRCIDLFCGAGGLSYGLNCAGIEVAAGVDTDPNGRYPFEQNIGAPYIEQDIHTLRGADLQNLFSDGKYSLLAGCAPCQPFSIYRQKYAHIGTSNRGLLYEFSRLVEELKPDLVSMENVPGVSRYDPFLHFVGTLRRHGYYIQYGVLDCTHFGVPQRRKRLVLLASRLGPIALQKGHAQVVTVKDAIGHMQPISAGESASDDPLHNAASLSAANTERIQHSIPGGTWRDWPPRLRNRCHRRSSGAKYPSIYGRMVWDEPAPTITTLFYNYGSGRFGHPQQDRALSLREGALLQSFPNDYAFVPEGQPLRKASVSRLIGNAIPPLLAEEIGNALLAHVTEANTFSH